MDNKLYTCGVFIDLKKAFDTVNHKILLQKLYDHGIKCIFNDWFSSHLKLRLQTTNIGPQISEKVKRLSRIAAFPKVLFWGLYFFVAYK